MRHALIALAAGALTLAAGPAALAEEGLWTFDDAPTGAVRQSLGVRIDQAWLGHLQRASVRLTSGCSGSTVSPKGLVLTSEHCIAGCEESLSAGGADYVRDGFLTDGVADERRCPGLEAEILLSITDVTDKIFAAGHARFGRDYVSAREAALTRAEKAACGGDPRLRCQVISFFDGGEFKVYKYRSYKDVRLVFAPEFGAAFFGGDPDNFNFPRYAVDFAFLRLYDAGKAAATSDFLAWSRAAPRVGEAVFLAGNPGTTERHLTAEQLRTLRDLALPAAERQREELRGRLIAFSRQSAEHRQVALEPLFQEENSLKVLKGRIAALDDPAIIPARQAEETELKSHLASDPDLAAEIGDPWADIAQTQRAFRDQFAAWRQLESGAGGGSQLFEWARILVRGAVERQKRPADRLPDFAPSRLALIEKILLDPKPVSADLEKLLLGFWLTKTAESLGADSASASVFVGKDDPAGLAARLVEGSRLADPEFRRALWSGGPEALAACGDPLVAYVLATDPISRAARRVWEDEVVGPADRAGERIERLRFSIRQHSLYPDATFSLRLSYGRVEGSKANGVEETPFTTLAGLYVRASGEAPYDLPRRWLAARPDLDPATMLDFVTTTDITGGASGSPVVDAAGEIVGTAFDGNLASIAGDFVYDGDQNRTISVTTAAISEALAKVYGRAALLNELEGQKRPGAL
jgi:hypothetical protein